MTSMFSGCSGLTSLDLSNLNTSNVLNMSYMFSDCTSLANLTGLDTSNVEDMTGMFSGCTGLTSLDLTDLNTSTTYTTNDIGVAGATRPYDLPGQAEPAGPVVTFVYSGKTVLTIRALEVGGTVTVPSVEEMESTYSIQNATFT